MPYLTSRDRRPILNARVGHHFDRLISRWFDSSYIAADGDTGQKYVYPNMPIAVDSATGKYVPYSLGASYGAGSDDPVGVMDEYLDVTQGDEGVTPVWHGKLLEAHCYIYGAAYGNITDAVKTVLDDITWV